MSGIRVTVVLDEARVFAVGLHRALDGIRITDGGKVIVPIVRDGIIIGNPGPCGSWERVGDER